MLLMNVCVVETISRTLISRLKDMFIKNIYLTTFVPYCSNINWLNSVNEKVWIMLRKFEKKNEFKVFNLRLITDPGLLDLFMLGCNVL